MLPEFLEPAVEVPDVRYGPNDPLAIELQHDPKRGMRRRVLWSKVQDPPFGHIFSTLELLERLDVKTIGFRDWFEGVRHLESGSVA